MAGSLAAPQDYGAVARSAAKLAGMRLIHSRARRYDVKSATGKPAGVKAARCSAMNAADIAGVEPARCSGVEPAGRSALKSTDPAGVKAAETAGVKAAVDLPGEAAMGLVAQVIEVDFVDEPAHTAV